MTKWDKQWNETFDLTKEFVTEFGRFPNSTESFKGVNIGFWLFTQGYLYRKGELKEWRSEKLKTIYFPFSLKGQKIMSLEERWQKNFKLLVEFNDKYGRLPYTCDTFKGHNIGKWVNYLRSNKRKLTYEQIEQLDSVGFIWDMNNYLWMSKYNLLKEYINKFGKLPSVRTIYKNVNLGLWCCTQRQIRKHTCTGLLTEERIQLLDKVNFRWN